MSKPVDLERLKELHQQATKPPWRYEPAAIRFISYEPALGPIDRISLDGIHWLICGGESGPKARPMHPDWARDIRDRCVAAKVAFFFKQFGEWSPNAAFGDYPRAKEHTFDTGKTVETYGGPVPLGIHMLKIGKKNAGRLLDGREWNEYPEVTK